MEFIQSPNFTKGRGGNQISMICIHWFGTGTISGAISSFQNTARQASAHYLISNDRLVQMVKEEDTAWHSGVFKVNQKSIGIEHDAGIDPQHDLSEKSYQTSAKLVKEICQRYGIPLDREHIKKHSEIKNTQCPGTIDIDKLIKIAKGDNMGFSEEHMAELFRKFDFVTRNLLFGHVDGVGLDKDVDFRMAQIKGGSTDAFADQFNDCFNSVEFKSIWIKIADMKPTLPKDFTTIELCQILLQRIKDGILK